MTQQSPVFSIPEFELRNYTNPYLSPEQSEDVSLVEDRVNSQLDFLAQMLGWNGPDYWTNLPSTVDQKRQLLGGTFGVYDSYILPRVYEVRNWNNTIVIDRVDVLEIGKQTATVRIILGDTSYTLQSVETEGDRFVVSIGELTDQFFTDLANGEQIKLDIPTFRPAPFYRPSAGASADYEFLCKVDGTSLSLYPSYDTQYLFPFQIPVLFAGSVYYFDKPVYFALDDTLVPQVKPDYDSEKGLWYFRVPDQSFTGFLAVAQSSSVEANNAKLEVKLQQWEDPSDWGSENVLNNFTGTWGNKGGPLPFNFAFDSLSLHGFNEAESIVLPPVSLNVAYNDIVNFVYSQKVTTSPNSPPNPSVGDLWWNAVTGVLSVWLSNDFCGNWVEIDYRNAPTQTPPVEVDYVDVAAFRAGSTNLGPGAIARIVDITGLAVSDNVIGVQGTLTTPGWLILHRLGDSPFWGPDEVGYANVGDFSVDSALLPNEIPVTIYDATDLRPTDYNYTIDNLPITITGDYEVILKKFYNNNWQLYPDSILKYIAYSRLFGGPEEGQMWWDFVNTDPNTRAAAIYYDNAYVAVNLQAQSGAPSPPFDISTLLFYCNGTLLTANTNFITEDFTLFFNQNVTPGEYSFTYTAKTFAGAVQLPKITISDSITTAYRADITDLVFSGLTYYMSPSVYNAETPLRLWKSEALQAVDSIDRLEINGYSNPLLADINTGPGAENWEKYFVRLPLEYGREENEWQKTTLVCKDFAYWGSTVDPEVMKCPPPASLPEIYEELILYETQLPDYTYVYSEPYLYSNVGYSSGINVGVYQNSGVFPSAEVEFDEFTEGDLVDYDPLHNRRAVTDVPAFIQELNETEDLILKATQDNDLNALETLKLKKLFLESKSFGDWEGIYLNVNPCTEFSGYLIDDIKDRVLEPAQAPVWDASIYKYPPTCDNEETSYYVDANHFKVGYAYFCADASAAEDAFFDISQEAAWRYPVNQPRTSYVTPR